MRITGLATGMDMDQIIKDSMKPYRIKIDKKGQDKEILEIKQKLYREIIKDSREFYNKYFDVTNKDSLILTKNWTTTQLQSSNANILTVTGGSDVKPENYTITGTTATAAKAVVKEIIDNKIVINGKEFTLKGTTEREQATNLTNELKESGINIVARYSDFAGDNDTGNQKGFIFESTVLGKDSIFTIGGTFSGVDPGIKVQGKNATASTINGFTTSDFKTDSINKITLDIVGGQISFEIKAENITENGAIDNEKLKNLLNEKLKPYNFSADINEGGEITISSIVLGKDVKDPNININDKTIPLTAGEDATFTINTLNIDDIKDKKISINGNIIDLSKKDPAEDLETYFNRVLKEQGINITAKLDGTNIVLTSNKAGADYKVDVSIVPNDAIVSTVGTNAEIIFKDSKGGVYTHTGNSNTVTLDGVTFKFSGKIPVGEVITVNGKQDVTEIKDKLVKFINEYNTLVEKLNTLTSEKRNRSFMPLTSDQKKEMSEDEIKLWNEKVQKGQLSRDNDLTRISNSMKQAMRSLVEGSGLSLEKIGINPVADYQGTKNGTFTIDENKLVEALEENSEEVMNLFIKAAPSDINLSRDEKYSKTGLLQRIKDILYNETVTVASSILKKAGIENSSTVYNNEISKSIEKYEQKMKDMETDFSRREQALYTKYSYLETMMNKYNSQQSYLMQQLGMG